MYLAKIKEINAERLYESLELFKSSKFSDYNLWLLNLFFNTQPPEGFGMSIALVTKLAKLGGVDMPENKNISTFVEHNDESLCKPGDGGWKINTLNRLSEENKPPKEWEFTYLGRIEKSYRPTENPISTWDISDVHERIKALNKAIPFYELELKYLKQLSEFNAQFNVPDYIEGTFTLKLNKYTSKLTIENSLYLLSMHKLDKKIVTIGEYAPELAPQLEKIIEQTKNDCIEEFERIAKRLDTTCEINAGDIFENPRMAGFKAMLEHKVARG